MANIRDINIDNNIVTFETVKEKLENLIEKHNSIVEIDKRLKTIKNEYAPIKKNISKSKSKNNTKKQYKMLIAISNTQKYF